MYSILHRREPVTPLTPAPLSSVTIMMYHRIWSPSATGAIFPVTAEALTGAWSCRRRMQLCRSQAADAPGASCCGWGNGNGLLASRRVLLIENLCHQLHELWEQVSRPHSIRDDKKGIKQVLSETPQLPKPEPSNAARGQAKSLCIRLESGNSCDGEGWRLVTSGPGGEGPCSPCRSATMK